MTEIEQSLNEMREKHRAGLALLQAQVESMKRSNSRQYQSAKQLLDRVCKEQWLIDKTTELAGGNQSAIMEIEALLRTRATHLHTRLLAAMLLGMIGSARSLEMLAGRIVDRSDLDAMRFSCAMLLGQQQNSIACALILKAINDPSTDEEFDDVGKVRTAMIDAGVPLNLRMVMISDLLDSTWGTDALVQRVRSPLSFRNGWQMAILSLWLKTESESYILLAADVLKNRNHPDSLRINAANVLYLIRRESKGKRTFPKRAWDVVHSVWGERDYGSLHHAIREILKLQGT